MLKKLSAFFSRYEFFIPLIIFILFLAAALPGNSWGAPALWNPDEMIWRADKALSGGLQFDVNEPDYNYPSLPKYVMYAIGYVVYKSGHSTYAFIVAARSFSALLGALVGALVYYLARMIGANKRASALAGLFYIASGISAANSRFAHNDLYLQFFTVLCVFFVLKYQYDKKQRWLFASFFCVGLAASSKYTGGSVILLPIATYLLTHRREIARRWLTLGGTLALGAVVAYLGYGLGTPRSLLEPLHYFTEVFVSLRNYPQYGFNSGSPVGLYGQWSVFKNAVGAFAYYAFLFSFLWFALRLVLWKWGKVEFDGKRRQGVVVLLAAVLIFDLPFLISINYIDRYFIPFTPFLSLLSAFCADEILRLSTRQQWRFLRPLTFAVLALGFVYSALRLGSIALLFLNDSRIPASAYIETLRGYQKNIEYTLYPPRVERGRFRSATNYPIYFVKYPNDVEPLGYNLGEEGLLARDVDYFVIDSYTYRRFYNDSICATIPVECDFFKRLLDGDVSSFRLTKEYRYRLPSYLPKLTISAVNPDILIYERAR
ncbi:MAG: phospholipid carrier-dependent glycosyltransferase [Anaerolineales bacterium]|nr:phospholipid carrier-dependent glycosyltransferase [Anaerolineales bacterium]